jgi:hypothetical protein
VPAVATGQGQGLEQPRDAVVEHAPAVAAGLVAEGAGQPTLADPGRAGDQNALMPVEPAAGHQPLEQRPVEAAWGAQVDVLDAGIVPQGGDLQPRCQAPALALGGLAVDQQAEPFLKAEGSDVGGSSLIVQRLGHAGQAERDQPLLGGVGEHGGLSAAGQWK